LVRNRHVTKVNIKREGEDAVPVFLTKIKDNRGASPAARLAATEYSTDNTVQRNLRGNIISRY
jgi:hypothetical protein